MIRGVWRLLRRRARRALREAFPDYLVKTWGKLFGLQVFRQFALDAFQDLAAWKKW